MGFQIKAYDSAQLWFSLIFSLSLVSTNTITSVNKVCLNKPYSKIWTCKHLSDICPVKNGLKGGDA